MHLMMEHTHRKTPTPTTVTQQSENKSTKSDKNARGNRQSEKISPFSTEPKVRESETHFQGNVSSYFREYIFI